MRAPPALRGGPNRLDENAWMCTTCCWISTSASANHGPDHGDLISLWELVGVRAHPQPDAVRLISFTPSEKESEREREKEKERKKERERERARKKRASE